MLPVYRAHSFLKILQKGGRTKPWLILVNEGSELVPYVVKMFSAELVYQRDSVLNEVLGNVLAREFDLPVPKAALIEMDTDFHMTINDIDAIAFYENQVDHRIKFGTRFISPSFDFQHGAFSTQELKNIIDIDTVFAFDFLIRNSDRTNFNPNFRVSGNHFYLIDHDLGFQIDESTTQDVLSMRLTRQFIHHIFYEILRSSWTRVQQHYFETFHECLQRLQLSVISSSCSQLSNYGYSIQRHQILKDYFKDMKDNSAKFVTLLRAMLS